MTAPATGVDVPVRRDRFRLTRRVFWDLALYMVSLGLAVGAVFPPFAILMGIPSASATRPSFVLSCLAAGFLVGALNYALCRGVVGGRLALLSEHLREVAGTIAQVSRTGDWPGSTSRRITVNSDDQLGDTARAFNSLLDALEAGEHFRSLVRNASDVITVVDRRGTITYQTPSAGWVLGYPPDALVGKDVRTLVHDEDRSEFARFLTGVISQSPQPLSVGSRMRHRNGGWRWVETVANNLLGDPAVSGVVLTTRDVSDRHELQERLREQAFHDPLTGLPNRAPFMERLRAAEELFRQDGSPFAVLFIDLDNLKSINDNLGHEVGDSVLKAVSARIEGCVRPADTAARLSGDEFAVLLRGPDTEVQAQRVSDRILASLHEPVHLGDTYVNTGASIGVATSATCGESHISVLRGADLAMYVAKTSGKGRSELFQPHHHSAQLEQDQLRADLHHALDANQLSLHYQPMVELSTGRIAGYEALLRWQHPERGLVPPARFIPLAEETGLIVPIGRWVTEEAVRQAAAWREQGAHVRMSINVSARQLQHPALVADIAEALRRWEVDPTLLTLEITESVLVRDAPGAAASLAQLKHLGVLLALDDFGTGYSSLSYLRRFPIDILKIDKSFVDGVATSPAERAVAEAIITLGRNLGLEVIAEGLESEEQVAVVRRLRCRFGQGYHFCAPVPADRVPHLHGPMLGAEAAVQRLAASPM